MTNRRAASPGQLGTPTREGQVSAGVPVTPADTSAEGRALAAVFNGLGAQIGHMADKAAIRQGEAEGLAAGSAAGAGTPGTATGSGSPAGTGTGAPAAGGAGTAGTATGGGSAAGAGTGTPSRVSGGAADLDNLSGSARAVLAAITQAGVAPELKVTSGYRDPARNAAAGGAKSSQHLHGNALDLDISGLDATQKARLLDVAIASGARGVGIYGNGASLHLDTRGTPATWGGNAAAPYQGHGAELAPDWARPALARMLSGAAPAAAEAPAGPAPNLRRDGTLRGDAHDQAAERAFGWRFAANLDTAMASAFDANKDNPAGWTAAVDRIRSGLRKNPNLADPQLREAAEQHFSGRVSTYDRAVAQRAEAKVRAEAGAAADEQYLAAAGDLERRAYILGGTPDGDAELAREVERNARVLDSQAAANAITPSEAAKRKRDLTATAAKARLRGAYDALPDLAAKERFAAGLTQEWAEKTGPLSTLDYASVHALQNELTGKVRAERAADTRSNVAGRMSLERALKDDVESLKATGAPGLVGGRELDPVEVTRVLGPERALRWADARQDAKALHDATADFGVLPEAEILARVEALAPEPGMPDFAASARIHAAAQAKAQKLIDLRRTDPAAAVEAELPTLRAAKAALDPAKPGSYRQLAQLRMDAQSALGIPEMARAPLTRREASALAMQITRAANPGRVSLDMAREVAARYGDLSDEVLVQVLVAGGARTDAAGQAAGLLRNIGFGPRPAVPVSAPAAGDAVRADAAMGGAAGRPAAFKDVPTYRTIRALLDGTIPPEKFDVRFGTGWADFYFRDAARAGEEARRAPPADPDGESWTPDQ